MSASVLYMSMSLDGYIAGPNDEPDNPGGDGFGRLHEWIPDGETFRSSGQLIDEINAAGALLAGRRPCLLSIRCRMDRAPASEDPHRGDRP